MVTPGYGNHEGMFYWQDRMYARDGRLLNSRKIELGDLPDEPFHSFRDLFDIIDGPHQGSLPHPRVGGFEISSTGIDFRCGVGRSMISLYGKPMASCAFISGVDDAIDQQTLRMAMAFNKEMYREYSPEVELAHDMLNLAERPACATILTPFCKADGALATMGAMIPHITAAFYMSVEIQRSIDRAP